MTFVCDLVSGIKDMITSQNHLLYAFTVILLMASSTSSKLVESFLTIREGVLLKGHPMHWQRTTSFFSCAHLCLRKEGCRYINYKASTETEGVCELLKDTSRDHNNGYIDGPGWFHGQIVHSRVSARTGSNTPGETNADCLLISIVLQSLVEKGFGNYNLVSRADVSSATPS